MRKNLRWFLVHCHCWWKCRFLGIRPLYICWSNCSFLDGLNQFNSTSAGSRSIQLPIFLGFTVSFTPHLASTPIMLEGFYLLPRKPWQLCGWNPTPHRTAFHSRSTRPWRGISEAFELFHGWQKPNARWEMGPQWSQQIPLILPMDPWVTWKSSLLRLWLLKWVIWLSGDLTVSFNMGKTDENTGCTLW